MRLILTFLAMLMSGSLAANALTIDYSFKNQEECTHENHTKYTDLMMVNQGKLVEIIKEKDVNTFYHSWAEAVEAQYDGDGNDVDRIFIFKSYPQAGLMFAYRDGCLIGARVFPLDMVNKILESYVTKKKTGDL